MAENKLKRYREKRNFQKTGEPFGKEGPASDVLSFSVQHHLARADHFDLRLEWKGVLLSWAVPKGPSFCTADKRLAMRVEDHPLDYINFEGVIPKGEYGGGTVMLWDEGSWQPRTPPDEGLKEGSLKFTLHGKRLKGDWALVRIKGKEGEEPWLLIKEKDSAAKKTAGISRFTRSIRSGRSMEEIAAQGTKNPFSHTRVMLPKLCESLPRGEDWLFELKYDGHRTLAYAEGGKVTLSTRNGHNCTAAFRAAAEAVGTLLGGRCAVLDGEMVVVGKDGIPDFSALQAYTRRKREGLCYVLFDLLALDGEDLRPLPLLERKKRLCALLEGAPPLLCYSRHTAGMTKAQCEAIRARGMEGIVIKRAHSPYTAGKNGDWLKLKFRNVREFVIGGYTSSSNGTLRSLLLGYYEGKTLRYAGRVGTGLPQALRKELKTALSALSSPSSPFSGGPQKAEGVVWTKPKLAAQVEYAELTSSGLLRQASFKGLRTDKPPKEITAELPLKGEEPGKVSGISVTHPEKVMFPRPAYTKLQMAQYYAAVAPRMFPYVQGRPLSLVCCPSGIEGEHFFRRHLEGSYEGVGFSGEEFFLKGETGLVALVQYNAVEFHIQGRKKAAGRPDTMVFDLDPDEALPLSKVRKGVKLLKETLESLGLISFLKTSGGKGYHVVVPFRTGTDSEKFRDFSKGVALLMEQRFPALFTANMLKKARTGKIFLDWQRNGRGATSVAPYSLRARAGAPVSMPIGWEELPKISPASVTLSVAIKRLDRPDPWENYFSVKERQSLKFNLPEKHCEAQKNML